MKVIYEDRLDGTKRFCFEHWRYCDRCGKCHGGKNNECGRESPKGRRRHEPDNGSGGDGSRDPGRRDECGRGEWEPCRPRCPDGQAHVHEFEGSTDLAGFCGDAHNHRLAGVSGEAIRALGSHIHKIWTRTDFFDHFHYACKFTGPAVPVYADGQEDCRICGGHGGLTEWHVHFAEGATSQDDAHRHRFRLATLIESPLLPWEEDARPYAREPE